MAPVPPVAVDVSVRVVPEHTGGEFDPILFIATADAGCVIFWIVVIVQPFASVTVMVYEPDVSPVNTPFDAPVVFTVGPAIT